MEDGSFINRPPEDARNPQTHGSKGTNANMRKLWVAAPTEFKVKGVVQTVCCVGCWLRVVASEPLGLKMVVYQSLLLVPGPILDSLIQARH